MCIQILNSYVCVCVCVCLCVCVCSNKELLNVCVYVYSNFELFSVCVCVCVCVKSYYEVLKFVTRKFHVDLTIIKRKYFRLMVVGSTWTQVFMLNEIKEY